MPPSVVEAAENLCVFGETRSSAYQTDGRLGRSAIGIRGWIVGGKSDAGNLELPGDFREGVLDILDRQSTRDCERVRRRHAGIENIQIEMDVHIRDVLLDGRENSGQIRAQLSRLDDVNGRRVEKAAFQRVNVSRSD